MRLMPSMALVRSRPYLRTIVRWRGSSSWRTSAMNPSIFKISAMCFFNWLAGTSVRSWRASAALRMRVSMSETGSVIMSSPARLDYAWNLALESEHPKANATELEVAVVATRAPADLAAVAMTRRKLGSLVELRELTGSSHGLPLLDPSYALKGMPSWVRSARPSSSVLAVVTKEMLIPLMTSILS